MRKIAFFVEGQTEQLFIKKLLTEIAGEHDISIEEIKCSYGRQQQRQYITISAQSSSTDQKYYVLIYDCGTDSKVKDDILESFPSLSTANFETVITRKFYLVNNFYFVSIYQRLKSFID